MKKSDLLDKIEELELTHLIPERATNKDLEMVMGTDYFNKHPEVQTWGMKRRLFDLQNPQLCFNFKELKPQEQEDMLKSPDWLAETKIDGMRCIITYHPDYGFEFFSRDISELTFLPNNYTDKIVMIKDNIVKYPKSYKGVFKQSFILDGEVLVSNKMLDTTAHGGGFSITELNATVSILGSLPERAREIQLDGNPLKFCVFDCLEIGDTDISKKPYRERRKYLLKLLSMVKGVTPFELPESTIENKQEFFDRLVSEGNEGVVLKNMNEPYHATTSRNRRVQVKMKRTMSGALNQDIDVFISGSILPKKNSALHVLNLIGGIKVSLFIKELDGTETEHWIGTVSGITDSLRKKMTIEDEFGNPTLNPEYYGKVMVVEGQDISSVNLRLSHARALSWAFRSDKNSSDCLMTREDLMSQVL